MKKQKIETGADVLRLREQLGLKQEEFMHLLGYAPGRGIISPIENGSIPPTARFLLACNQLAKHTAKERQAVKNAKENLKKRIETFNQ